MAGFMGGGPAWWGVVVFTVDDGESVACQGNLISGNTADGVHIEAGEAIGAVGPAFNSVVGNFIGTDITGGRALPNGENGVHLENGANNNLIGRAGLGNLISGNKEAGVLIEKGDANGAVGPTANAVIGNFIGTDVMGTARIPNDNGIKIQDAPGNLIAFNLISANKTDGVFVGGAAAGNNTVVANMIGTDITGLNNLGNGQDGIDVQSVNRMRIGGQIGDIRFGFAAPVSNLLRALLLRGGNIIAFNVRFAVSVDPSFQIDIENNSMFDNGAGGIALLDGSNNDQPAPWLTSVDTVQETGLYASTYYDYHIKGTMFGAADTSYHIQFFSSGGSDGEGDTLLGDAWAYTDSTGEAQIDTLVTALPNGEGSITATATDGYGNTSEFASPVAASPPPSSFKTPTSLGVSSSSPTITVGDAVTFYATTEPG
jgi:titin